MHRPTAWILSSAIYALVAIAGTSMVANADDIRQSAPTPSFDCARAEYPDERAICASVDLSQLDNVVATGYAYVRGRYGDRYAKSIGSPLFQARRACGSDAACIKLQQIGVIKKYQSLGAPIRYPGEGVKAFGDFPLASCKGANATITQLSGVNTDHASMVGIITEPDAIEYCTRQKGAQETLKHCVRETLRRENGSRYRAAANCPQHLLESKVETIIEQFKLVREEGENAWKSMRTGEVLGNNCGAGTPPLFGQFEILCPGEAESLDLH